MAVDGEMIQRTVDDRGRTSDPTNHSANETWVIFIEDVRNSWGIFNAILH